MTQRYAVALYVPFVVRVSGIDADSPGAAIEAAREFVQAGGLLDRGLHDGALDCEATAPTLCYIEPHDPGDPIGALVDLIDTDAGEVLWDHPQSGQYHSLDALELYAKAPAEQAA